MEQQNWSLSEHARQRILEYGVDPRKVLDTVLHFEVEYGGDPSKYDPATRIRQKGDLAVVVNADRMVIITVLMRRQENWGRKADS